MADYRQVKVADGARISKQAVLLGDVTIGEGTTVLHFAVVRGDDDKVVVGKNSNIQENCTIHCSPGLPTILGDHVTIGHNCVLHGCEIGDNTVIGMGSIVMDGVKIGKNCMVGAGTLITQRKVFPDNCMIMGRPAQVKRMMTEEDIAFNNWSADVYIKDGQDMLEQGVL